MPLKGGSHGQPVQASNGDRDSGAQLFRRTLPRQSGCVDPVAHSDSGRGQRALGEIGTLGRSQTVSLLTRDAMQYSLDVLAWRDKAPTSVLSEKAEAAARAVLPPGVTARKPATMARAPNPAGHDGRDGAGHAAAVRRAGARLWQPHARGHRHDHPAAGGHGAAWGLLLFDKAMALPAILGIILLFSIIVKNSILMVDFIHSREKTGEDPMTAAQDSIRLRYRPILMTAFGTVAGLLPVALEHAVGLERLSPLADTAIGGLLLGTVLTLFYLPMFYVWVEGRRKGTEAAHNVALPHPESGIGQTSPQHPEPLFMNALTTTHLLATGLADRGWTHVQFSVQTTCETHCRNAPPGASRRHLPAGLLNARQIAPAGGCAPRRRQTCLRA